MQDVELFVHMAEIAGVFVGFGALIAVRSARTGDIFDVAGIEMVVWQGVVVLVVALVPLVISRYGVTGHGLWLVCSVIGLAIFWVGDAVLRRLSPDRMAWLEAMPLPSRKGVEIVGVFIWLPMTIALILIVLGLLPGQEEALYFTSVALNLAMALMILLWVVFGAARPKPAPEGAAQPAPGGTSA